MHRINHRWQAYAKTAFDNDGFRNLSHKWKVLFRQEGNAWHRLAHHFNNNPTTKDTTDDQEDPA